MDNLKENISKYIGKRILCKESLSYAYGVIKRDFQEGNFYKLDGLYKQKSKIELNNKIIEEYSFESVSVCDLPISFVLFLQHFELTSKQDIRIDKIKKLFYGRYK